ncbi:hypothetical protein PJ900_03735 (plasmid) [Tistrella mobilis]|uniref:hypothetical protein n=1 Tax=Tistrella mobilis TaxID=171437 RepID=UPI0012E7A1A3|nr:hypothetical protein [Tistrella mobilis]
MLTFSTEFPVKSTLGRGEFIAEVLSWLRGTTYSQILSGVREEDFDQDAISLRAANGEDLRIRELKGEAGTEAIGFRYDNPDISGRLWRTEAVLSLPQLITDKGLLRLRTHCISTKVGAELHFPRKPYIITSLIRGGLGDKDGSLYINAQAQLLKDNEDDLMIASYILSGEITEFLPIIYLSAYTNGEYALQIENIKKMAFELGGVAHVIVEPGRSFSFKLRELSSGRNVYNGAVGIYLPERGLTKVFRKDKHLTDSELIQLIKGAATKARSHMPTLGWDWLELQEQYLQRQRETESVKLSGEGIEKIYQEQVGVLKEKISELEEYISSISESESTRDVVDDDISVLKSIIGNEIYPGEIMDRIRIAAKMSYEQAEAKGLDDRSSKIFKKISEEMDFSSGLLEFKEDLKRSTRDQKKFAEQVSKLLARHGYSIKAENKHIRMVPKDGYIGLPSITLSKTPGEARGLDNAKSQIEAALGLRVFKIK